MSYKKITESDLLNKGVVGLPDTPELSAFEMQRKFEEVAREVIIPAFNQLVEALIVDLGEIYTKDEVQKAIRDKVTSIGAGDMAMYVYDTDGDGIVDRAKKLASAVKIGNASFDGSKAITAEQMGMAQTVHSHKKSDISDFPSSIKNPNALTIQLNGTTKATYDGGAAAVVNVTPSSIGAATSGQGKLASDLTSDIKYIKYVSALPASPNADTLYLVKK